MPRNLISGQAGETWTNDGPKAQYQLIVNWGNSCGICVQYDHQIGPFWPTPYHRSCRCTQAIVFPGHPARPFVDYRAKILTVSRSQQANIMGSSNLAMVESGLVAWPDVVTSGRVRSLREVVSRGKLSVDEMVKAGVRRSLAREAFDAANTGTHTAAEARRDELARAILAKGYTRVQLVNAAGTAIAPRLSLGGFPPPAPGGPTAPGPIKPASSTPIKPASTAPVVRTEVQHRRWLGRIIDGLRRRFGLNITGNG